MYIMIICACTIDAAARAGVYYAYTYRFKYIHRYM